MSFLVIWSVALIVFGYPEACCAVVLVWVTQVHIQHVQRLLFLLLLFLSCGGIMFSDGIRCNNVVLNDHIYMVI